MARPDFPNFRPSVPRAASGGIKAQQGSFAKSWWARRWIAVLEGFRLGPRLMRGRSYARRGQVLDIRLGTGLITAKVQGSRPEPYAVEIRVKTLTARDEGRLAAALSRKALFAAKLLAGEMPRDIEQALRGTGVSLFPNRRDDLKTECSCPDWSNPCKHIAAVYYLMGEEFDRDPFLIFKLRGIDRDRLTALLSAPAHAGARRRGRGAHALERARSGGRAREPDHQPGRAAPAAEPLAASRAVFWDGAALPPGWMGEVRTPPVAAALLMRLGNFPFWRGNARLAETLTPVYVRASGSAREIYAVREPE